MIKGGELKFKKKKTLGQFFVILEGDKFQLDIWGKTEPGEGGGGGD